MSNYDYSTICRHIENETKEISCDIKGTLPSWLQGSILYNGPAMAKFGNSEYKHAFDSAALLQKITFADKKILYSTKFLESDTYLKNQKAQGITIAGFGTPGPSDKGMLSRLKNTMDSDKMMSDNACLSVSKMGDKYFALGETPFFLELDPETLQVTDKVNTNKVFSLATQSIHLQEDDHEYYTCAQAITMTGPKYAILKFPKDGTVKKAKTMATIPCRWRLSPCYVHSMALTKNYVLLIEPPLAVSIMDMLGDILTNKPFIDGLHWHKETALFHIVDRRTWKLVSTQYSSDSFFFLHFANAFEVSNHLVVDVCAYTNADILYNMFIDKLKSGHQNDDPNFHSSFYSYLKRFVIPLDTSGDKDKLVTLAGAKAEAKKTKHGVHLTSEDLFDIPFENPTSNEKFSEGGNRYVYGMGSTGTGVNYLQAIKLDIKTRDVKVFKEEGLYTCPPIFLATPGATEEDQGVLVFLALTSQDDKKFTLLVLDACTMQELCRGTAQVAAGVPLPLHGNYFAKDI